VTTTPAKKCCGAAQNLGIYDSLMKSYFETIEPVEPLAVE
jgi:hypothetical protein